ncbi:MAG: 50S ribosomal protein L32e [Thermoplasmata archaeon]|jgi:large subunit ribosomal protein L32e|nr:50S ribosomal protein L32e [Thermoplasmata archaeon]
MADAKPDAKDEATETKPEPSGRTDPTPKKSDVRAKPAKSSDKPTKATKKEAPKAPRRPTLEPELARLLKVRDATDVRRPKFVRTASHRYWRVGRWVSWRRPRGQQSKQRRHYGYRPVVVSIGFGSPRATRGLTPTGFRPVLVRTAAALETLDPVRDAVLIARTVGTRRRLVLEEAARLKGLHVLNPIGHEREE